MDVLDNMFGWWCGGDGMVVVWQGLTFRVIIYLTLSLHCPPDMSRRSSLPHHALPHAAPGVRPARPQLRVCPPSGDLSRHSPAQPDRVAGETTRNLMILI